MEAAKGNTVTINHDRYDLVFELTAREREPLKEEGVTIYDDILNKPLTVTYTEGDNMKSGDTIIIRSSNTGDSDAE